MSNPTAQFITQMKLRELHRQRARLREAYQRLGEEVAAARDPGDRLRRLYRGLSGLKFAGQPLHPELKNLEILLHQAEWGAVSPEVLSLWQGRLEEELAAGRLRSEFVYLFGALLEEWACETPADVRLVEESRQARDRLLHQATAAPEPNRHHEVLDPLFDSFGPALAEVGQSLRETWSERVRGPVSTTELANVLERLAGNIYQPPRLRREARQFRANDQMCKELADALTILVSDLHTWDWPAEGVPVRALWTRNKWRLYLDAGLPTACLLEVVANGWHGALAALLGDDNPAVRRARLKKLIDLNAPEVIMENERRMLLRAERALRLGFEEGDIWEEPAVGSAPEPESGCIVLERARHQCLLRRFDAGREYGGEYDDINQAVLLVHAEIQLARAAFPGRPVFVVKADLQDYYASIPHDVLLTALRELGLPEADQQFFARFLAVPFQTDGERPAKAQRGVPMGHLLSDILAELLMRLLERHVQRQARVRVVRQIDDICLLTPDAGAAVEAWKALDEFCAACGLRINRSKSGAVCIGGALPAELPRGRPRWGMLELDEVGQWHVHNETLEAHLKQSRERVAAAGSVLSRVQLYNANADYLMNALTLGAALGDAHRGSAERAVRQFHHSFFGPDRGIVAGLGETIRERFPLDGIGPGGIPEAWVYWPITAGGLGLRNPLVMAGQYAEAFRKRKKVSPPEVRLPGWNTKSNDWAAYYNHLLERVEPVEPADTKVMQALVNDFIARGSTISSGRQKTLAPYWRWILYTYGPQILQRFGTFRFLITELVPLQLISQQRLQDTSLDEAKKPAASGEDIPF